MYTHPPTPKTKVVKANKIIEAKYKLSVREQKLFLFMVSMIRKDDVEFKKYTISINELKKLLCPEEKQWGSIYKEFREIIFNLKSKPFSIKEGGVEHVLNWVDTVTMVKNSGEIVFQFSETLKPYLLQLKESFTAYDLGNVLQLKSRFAIRMYELLKQYEKIGRRKFEYVQLRELLGVQGDAFQRYYDFKRFVLLKAQSELEAKTDIRFSFKEFRHMRLVEAVEFDIHSNGKKPSPIPAISKDNKIIKQLAEQGFSNKNAHKLIDRGFKAIKEVHRSEVSKNYDSFESYLQEKIDLLNYTKQSRKISSSVGYLIAAIEDNYQNSTQEKKKVDERKIAKNLERKEALQNLEQKLTLVQADYHKRENAVCLKILDEKSLLKSITEELLASSFHSKFYLPELSESENYERPTWRGKVQLILRRKFPALFKEIDNQYLPEINSLERSINQEQFKRSAQQKPE